MTFPDPIIEPPSDFDRRCPVSIMPGQRCGRTVAAGQIMCENHLAMGSPDQPD